MDDDRAGGPDRVRLPGHDERSGYRPAYTWPRDDYDPPGGYGPPGYGPPGRYWPGYVRDGGIRSSRRASSWTAAALIAGVAATTGYLAHAIPATGTSSGTGKGSAHKAQQAHKAPGRTVVRAPSAPVVQAPVVTSGGSGAAGGGGGGD